MKLRIQGNSIRFRLSQSEVSSFGQAGSCESEIEFPNGESLIYRLVSSSDFRSGLINNTLTLLLPSELVQRWVNTEEVGISTELNLDNGKKLSILVEKDFQCLTERADDESDLFPNPKESH